MNTRPQASSCSVSSRMSLQKTKDTKPELIIRRLVHSLGLRFRVNNRDLPGSPDLANRKRKWVIFVHGCFWHFHEGCAKGTVPRNNAIWWREKLNANRNRDKKKTAQLNQLGFTVVVVWECEIRNLEKVQESLRKKLL